jgi:hypothetical protein
MSKTLNGVLVTNAGKEYLVVIDEDEVFTPTNLTEKTVWRFITRDGSALVIQGDKIDSIVIEQEDVAL